eukprot:5331337-Karenia_brevis.AAC.1
MEWPAIYTFPLSHGLRIVPHACQQARTSCLKVRLILKMIKAIGNNIRRQSRMGGSRHPRRI